MTSGSGFKQAEKSAVKLIAWMCFAEVLTMQGVFTFSALIPVFFTEWSLDGTEVGWISGIYYGGYVCAVAVLVTLTDWLDARRIYIGGVCMTIISSVGFALLAEGFWSAVVFRTLGGIGLAGTYMPGLKALTDRLEGKAQARATSFYTASFGIGSSLSFLVGGYVGELFHWRIAFWVAVICAVSALLLVNWVLEPKISTLRAPIGLHMLDFRPVLRNRFSMGWVACYTTHNYELFAFRSWIVAFLVFAFSNQPDSTFNIQPTVVAFIGILLGMPSSVFGNELALRFGRKLTVAAVMTVSALISMVLGFNADLPIPLLCVLVLIYGCFVTGDSASITNGVIESSSNENLGRTLSVYSSVGFIGSFLGPIGFGMVLDAFGGPGAPLGWGLAFASVGAVLVLGPALMGVLNRN